MELDVIFPGSIFFYKKNHSYLQALLKNDNYYELVQAFAELYINKEQKKKCIKTNARNRENL